MKRLLSAVILAGLFGSACSAQVVVVDPTQIAQDAANFTQELAQWANSLENQATQIQNQVQQIQQLQAQLQRMGDPNSLKGILNVNGLTGSLPLNSFQPGFASLKNLSNGGSGFADTGNGLYSTIPNTSPGGLTVNRNFDLYRKFDFMAQIRDQHENNSGAYASAATSLDQQIADTLAALDQATTETEIAKLHAKLTALVAQQQALSDQLHKAALDSTVQANDMEANRRKQQQAAAEAYDADADANFDADDRHKTLPKPQYQPVHVQ